MPTLLREDCCCRRGKNSFESFSFFFSFIRPWWINNGKKFFFFFFISFSLIILCEKILVDLLSDRPQTHQPHHHRISFSNSRCLSNNKRRFKCAVFSLSLYINLNDSQRTSSSSLLSKIHNYCCCVGGMRLRERGI